MSKQLLKINGLSVNVEDKEILHGINLEIKKGETHVLMGPNGAGKSTLGYALMGVWHWRSSEVRHIRTRLPIPRSIFRR